MEPIVAVHGGAGLHKERIERVCAQALTHGKGDIVEVIKFMENEPSTNCGTGSNLTADGRVECEAVICHSEGNAFGAVGSVTRIRNPIEVAALVARGSIVHDGGLLPPSVLVGSGAEKFAESRGIIMCDNEDLITEKAKKQWNKVKSLFSAQAEERADTVGAVSMSPDGRCSAASSSGGFIFKTGGRLGHCTQIGGAVWAEQRGSRSVAVSLSGCGEYIAKSLLAEHVASAFFEWDFERGLLCDCVREIFLKSFVDSPLLSQCKKSRVLAGGIALFYDKDIGFLEFLAFHNTAHLPFAYGKSGQVGKVSSRKPDENNFVISSFPLRF